MRDETLAYVADFYSQRAEHPLRTLAPGQIVVSASPKRYSACALFVAIFPDRCLISMQYELVDTMRRIAQHVDSTSRFLEDDVRDELVAACSGRPETGNVSTYSGIWLFCDAEMHRPVVDERVSRLTRENVSEAMGALGPVGIGSSIGYLLHDDAAYAYYVDGRPVAFAGTHPAGGMSDRIGDVCLGTLAAHRRRGYGRAAASATTGCLLRQGRVAVWGTGWKPTWDSDASIRTAQSIGYEAYCHRFEVRIGD